MYIDRPVRDGMLIEDERFAHFLPLLLGKLAFKAAGRAAKWLGKKALRGGKAAARTAASFMTQQEEPETTEQEIEQIPEFEAGEEMDVYAGDGGLFIRGDMVRDMEEDEFDELAAHVADYIERDFATVRDGDEYPDVEVGYDENVPQFAHFKKLRKKFKKLTKLVTKLGPLANLIPGGQVIGMATSLAGAAKKKGKRGRRGMAMEMIQQQTGFDPSALAGLASDYDFTEYDGETGIESEAEANEESRRIHGIASQIESDRRSVR